MRIGLLQRSVKFRHQPQITDTRFCMPHKLIDGYFFRKLMQSTTLCECYGAPPKTGKNHRSGSE
jgi:hypothetical protein